MSHCGRITPLLDTETSMKLEKLDRLLILLFLLGIGWRIYLSTIYYGWEESDYGNIAMVYGVWEGGFRHYDMSHMPGYYFFSALWLFVLDDSILAAKLTAGIGGALSLVGAGLLLRRLLGGKAACFAMLFLLIQPEYSLYSASSLREPLYSAFLLWGFWALLERKIWAFSILSVLAFSVRFEAPLFLIPIGLLGLRGIKERGLFLLILSMGIGTWMVYCYFEYETIAFWSHASSVNIETGLGEQGEKSTFEWLRSGFTVVWGLLFEILPSRVGWGSMIAFILCPWVWKDSRQVMLLWGNSFLILGVWLAIAFVAQHEVGHNLYWKWLYPVVPFFLLSSSACLWRLTAQYSFQKWILGVIVFHTWWVQGQETQRQLELSDRLYRPQLELAFWVEENLPVDEALIFDNIPACWVNRRPHELTLHSWFDLPYFHNPNELIIWAQQNQVEWILFFQEEWTQSPQKASFLVGGGNFKGENGQLKEVSSDSHYGWRWYHVSK